MQRGVRGAIQAAANERSAILNAARELMLAVIGANGIRAENAVSVFFTVTSDLNAAFPAEVRSLIGWNLVPFLCAQEIPVPGSLERVVRVLVLFETGLRLEEIQHQYLGATEILRLDLKNKED